MEMINFDDFINKTLGRKIDTDGYPKAQPYQCVDLAKYYNDCYFSPFQVYCSTTGYAKDWANNKYNNGLLDYYDETAVNNMIKGTLVVWGNCRVAPDSHIGFFVKDNGNGTFQCLQQNAPYPYVTLSNISYDGIIGAFIPKNIEKYIPKPEPIHEHPIYETLGDMYVRCGAGTNFGVKRVRDLTEDGKCHATSTDPDAYAVYKKGTRFTCYELVDLGKGLWARTPSGYVCVRGKSGTVYSIEVKD